MNALIEIALISIAVGLAVSSLLAAIQRKPAAIAEVWRDTYSAARTAFMLGVIGWFTLVVAITAWSWLVSAWLWISGS